MKVGAFQLEDSLPELRQPHAFALLRPWINAGEVGSTVIHLLEDEFDARPLGKLLKPSQFFDFTRYRPTIQLIDGMRHVHIPNSHIYYARRPEGTDFLFFHLFEPHMDGIFYTDSILEVLQLLGVKRYTLLGSMYDAVPHTRPLIVSGIASEEIMPRLQQLGIRRSDYEGPTTITILVSQEALKHSIETASLIVHLPQYTQFEEDYTGQLRLLEIVGSLYNLSLDFNTVRIKSEKQLERLNQAIEKDMQLTRLVEQLELIYETRNDDKPQTVPVLPPEIEKFLKEIDKRFQ